MILDTTSDESKWRELDLQVLPPLPPLPPLPSCHGQRARMLQLVAQPAAERLVTVHCLSPAQPAVSLAINVRR